MFNGYCLDFLGMYIYIYIINMYVCIMHLCPCLTSIAGCSLTSSYYGSTTPRVIGIGRSWHLPDCACRPRPRCTAATKPAPQRLWWVRVRGEGSRRGFGWRDMGKSSEKPGKVWDTMGPPSRNIKICSEAILST